MLDIFYFYFVPVPRVPCMGHVIISVALKEIIPRRGTTLYNARQTPKQYDKPKQQKRASTARAPIPDLYSLKVAVMSQLSVLPYLFMGD